MKTISNEDYQELLKVHDELVKEIEELKELSKSIGTSISIQPLLDMDTKLKILSKMSVWEFIKWRRIYKK